VWVPAHDRKAAAALEAAGHVVDAEPTAMALELEALKGSAARMEIDLDGSMIEVARLNDHAYGYDHGFERALAQSPDHAGHVYLARVDGRAVSCVVAADSGDDCGIFFVATREEARGRGLATALMIRALEDARERGCGTSTLQATQAGRPIYERLGYRDLGPIQMWERRK
jgi:GNAT superfamily N-acetyltransferase